MKIQNGEVIEEFESFVNPEIPIPPHITKITGITDEMVKGAGTIKDVLPNFLEFIGDATLVAHNADFDLGFIRYNCKQLGLKFTNKHKDTLEMARRLYPSFKNHKLGNIAQELGIKVTVAHRALDDVKTLVQVFNKMVVGAQDYPVDPPAKQGGQSRPPLQRDAPTKHQIPPRPSCYNIRERPNRAKKPIQININFAS